MIAIELLVTLGMFFPVEIVS